MYSIICVYELNFNCIFYKMIATPFNQKLKLFVANETKIKEAFNKANGVNEKMLARTESIRLQHIGR